MVVFTHCLLGDLDDTSNFARRLVAALPDPSIIAMTGDLGSGKTTLTQAIARALGVEELLPSPTFTLINEYITSSGQLVHSDLYRLEDTTEIRDLGLDDYFRTPHTITIVEWADRAPTLFPDSTIWIRLYLRSDDVRVASITTKNKAFWETF
jgi:tRNA threonylcarbamoyladenosine biosynthesis protein TsaE